METIQTTKIHKRNENQIQEHQFCALKLELFETTNDAKWCTKTIFIMVWKSTDCTCWNVNFQHVDNLNLLWDSLSQLHSTRFKSIQVHKRESSFNIVGSISEAIAILYRSLSLSSPFDAEIISYHSSWTGLWFSFPIFCNCLMQHGGCALVCHEFDGLKVHFSLDRNSSNNMLEIVHRWTSLMCCTVLCLCHHLLMQKLFIIIHHELDFRFSFRSFCRFLTQHGGCALVCHEFDELKLHFVVVVVVVVVVDLTALSSTKKWMPEYNKPSFETELWRMFQTLVDDPSFWW